MSITWWWSRPLCRRWHASRWCGSRSCGRRHSRCLTPWRCRTSNWRGCGCRGRWSRLHSWGLRIGVIFPGEKRAKRKMLHDRKLGQDLGIVHFNHTLVNLAPTIFDPGNVKQHRAVLPERTLFYIVDEANGRKVHVCLAVILDNQWFGNVTGLGCASHGTLEGHGVVLVNGPSELRRTKYVRHKGVIIQTPDAMGACRLERICIDELPDKRKISVPVSLAPAPLAWFTHGSMTEKTISLSTSASGLSLLKWPSFHKQPKKARKLSSWPVP